MNTAPAVETKQFTHLTMCVVQEWNKENALADAVRYEYKKLDTATTTENKGDKDIISTSFLDVCKGSGSNLNQAFLEALPTYQSARMVQSAVEDRAEYNEFLQPNYEQVPVIMIFGIDNMKVLAESRTNRDACVQADNNPSIKRVGVSNSTYSLEETLENFGLTTEELTAENLKEKTDLDVLVVPSWSISAKTQETLPRNVLVFDLQGSPEGNAKEIVKKTNAYFLGK